MQLLLSCVSPVLQKVVYNPKKYNPRVSVYLPRGFTIKRTAAEGNVEYSYYYSDSSVFYISSFPTPHSYLEIRKVNAFYDKRDAVRLQKELVLSGKDSAGFYWKDITINRLSIGFYRVPASNLEAMEKAVKSLAVKKQ